MKLHDECGPLCRAKTKFEVEDIMTNMAHSRTHTQTHAMTEILQPLYAAMIFNPKSQVHAGMGISGGARPKEHLFRNRLPSETQ